MTLATHEEVIEPEIVLSFAEHVEAVTGHHESFKFHRGKTVEAAVLTGASLAAAKADLPHGEWGDFLNEVDMDHRYARQFMSIGRNQAISNRSNCSDLPTAMRTLYELSRLEPEDIESGIESGAINPNMKISEAKSFKMRLLGLQQREIAEKLGAGLGTINRDLESHVPNGTSGTITNSRGQERPVRNARKEKEMPATLEHQSPFAVGHALVVPGNGKALAFVGEDGRAASNSETMRDALEWAREHPEQSRTDAADESGLSAGTLGNAYTALRNNHEIYRRNRLVERFDSIAQGLTYVADDLESLTADLERATAEDLEFGREYFEDAMKKLNAFRKQLNAKY